MTVTDMIESRRILHDYAGGPVLISPNGKKYLVILEWGDVARNGTWVQLISGDTSSLDAAAKPDIAAKLFTTSTAETHDLIKDVRWLADNEQVSFLWNDGQRPPQIVSVNIRTRQIRTLTRHPTSIVSYDISGDRNVLAYTARASHDDSKLSRMHQEGFAVGDQSIWALLEGNVDGWITSQHNETFVSTRPASAPRRVPESTQPWLSQPGPIRLSPNARYAIAARPAIGMPADWDNYTERALVDTFLPLARRHPARPNVIRQHMVIDIEHATARPLWNAPEAIPAGNLVWSPDSRTVLIGPTFLPVAKADAAGLAGFAVAEVDVATGHFIRVPLSKNEVSDGYRPIRWSEDGVLELAKAGGASETTTLRMKKADGEWRRLPNREQDQSRDQLRTVHIVLRQDPNTPPALYAVEPATGHERMILDLNPELRTGIMLGRVELVHWTAKDGRPWSGMLYYPVHYTPGQRFPFVIQTRGYSPKDFSLDGGFTTAFAAQPLANRDIAVLQVWGWPDTGVDEIIATPGEAPASVAGYESAIEHFFTSGLVDSGKVGIVGFSRTGWHVEYMLTHSKVPLAAAVVADNMDANYVQYVLGNEAVRSEMEKDNGAAPFGDGLQIWLRAASGFNTDTVRTPLRMELDTGPLTGIVRHWEFFSQLRYLGKPVELFVIPNIEHGVHQLQNPAQRLASQGGAVDWFCFWLKGEEDPDPKKAKQYARWRELRKLQEANQAAKSPK